MNKKLKELVAEAADSEPVRWVGAFLGAWFIRDSPPEYFWCNRRFPFSKKRNSEIMICHLTAGCTTHPSYPDQSPPAFKNPRSLRPQFPSIRGFFPPPHFVSLPCLSGSGGFLYFPRDISGSDPFGGDVGSPGRVSREKQSDPVDRCSGALTMGTGATDTWLRLSTWPSSRLRCG